MTWTDLDLTWTDLGKSRQSGSGSDLDTDTVSPLRGNRSSTSQDARTLEGESGSGDGFPGLSRSGGIAPPTINIPPNWRWSVANWPHERWTRWRRYVGEFASLDGPPTVEDIKGAELAVYDLLRTDGGLTL